MSDERRIPDEALARDAPRVGDPARAGERTPASDEVEMMMALLTTRYGGRLGPEQLDGVRQAVQGVVEAAVALRAVRLANADEPYAPFSPVRAGG